MAATDLDELFAGLLEHYKNLKRVPKHIGDFSRAHNPRSMRRAHICYNNGAYGLLEISTVAIVPFPRDKRHMTWTPNAAFDRDYESALDADRGSTVVSIDTWHEALAAIDGSQSSQ